MEKTLAMRAAELTNSLIQLSNDSGLPAFVVAMILKECYQEARNIADRQLAAEIEMYNNQEDSDQCES